MERSGGRNLLLLPVFVIFIISILFAICGTASADLEEQPTTYYDYPEEEPVEPQGPAIWQSVLRLIIVLPLVLLLAYFTSRFIARYSGVSTSGNMIKILAVNHLNKQNYLFLIEIGEKILLIASSPEKIEHLAEFSHDEFSEEELLRESPPIESAFQKQLTDKLKALKNLKGKASQNEDD